MKRTLIFSLIILGISSLFFFQNRQKEWIIFSEGKKNSVSVRLDQPEYNIEENETEVETVYSVAIESPVNLEKKILQAVPFTSQAPTGNWKDLIFQNACEEASLLMADRWLQGREFGTAREREVEIRRMTREEKRYFRKDSYDLSALDISVLAQKYFPEMRISLVKNVTTDDMKKALSEGNILIIPANGRKLHNPNFTAPGPLYHTLLIRGFDPVTDEFITNDSGTRRGSAYRYPSDIVFSAMQDYETGYHGKIFPDEKVMLIIQNPELGSSISK